MGELVFARPLVLAALVLPAALLLAARLFARPPREPTGSLRVWKEIAAAEGRGLEAARRRVPPPLWLLAASLALGIVALAAPRLEGAPDPRTWTAVVDRSPGMFLSVSHGADRTRLDAALDLARAHLVAAARPGDRVRWVSPERAGLELAAGELPPAEWLAADAWLAPRPPFVAHDLPGALWITDRALEAQSAGVFASGGEEAPGPIGDHAGRSVVWRGGDELVEMDAPTRAIRIERASSDDGGLLFDMAQSYAAGRGLVIASESSAGSEPALTLLFGAHEPGAVGGETHILGRDGWRVTARLATLPTIARPPETIATWLVLPGAADGSARALVRRAPGVVSIGFRPAGEPEGDPAAFAVSWARLFDEALLPRAHDAPLEARQAAGAPTSRAGAPPPEEASESAPETALDAGLAAAACVCALIAAGMATRVRS